MDADAIDADSMDRAELVCFILITTGNVFILMILYA